MDNEIVKNLKANIAYGGKNSGRTRIETNLIRGSVAEGIFVVEGEETTQIYDNYIIENRDGIILFNSRGSCKKNTIENNIRTGIQCAGTSSCEIFDNKIKDNISIGLMIKDPSMPIVRNNEIMGNHYQISIDKHVRKKLESYQNMNTLSGLNELPKTTCSIF